MKRTLIVILLVPALLYAARVGRWVNFHSGQGWGLIGSIDGTFSNEFVAQGSAASNARLIFKFGAHPGNNVVTIACISHNTAGGHDIGDFTFSMNGTVVTPTQTTDTLAAGEETLTYQSGNETRLGAGQQASFGNAQQNDDIYWVRWMPGETLSTDEHEACCVAGDTIISTNGVTYSACS